MYILNMFIPAEDIIFAAIVVVFIGISFLVYQVFKHKAKLKNRRYETLLKDTKDRLHKVTPLRGDHSRLIFEPPPGNSETGKLPQLQHAQFGSLLMQLDIPGSYHFMLILFLIFTPIAFAGLLYIQDFSLWGFLRGMNSENALTGLLITIGWLAAFAAGIYYLKHPYRVQFYRHAIIAATPRQTRTFSYEEIVDIDFKYYQTSLKKSNPNSGFVCTISFFNDRTLVLRQDLYANLEEKMIFWQKHLVA